MFERNAVVTSGTELNIPDGDCLVQYVADNVFREGKTLPQKKLQILAKLSSINYKPPRDRYRFIYEDMICTTVYDFTSNVDFLWKSSSFLKPDRPGWSELMQFCQKGEHPGKSDIVSINDGLI